MCCQLFLKSSWTVQKQSWTHWEEQIWHVCRAVYQFYSSISSENVLSFRIKGFFKLPSAHLVRSSSRMNTLTSISSFALQSVLISTNYLCIYEKYNHKNVWSSAQNRSFISQNHSQNTNILALCDNIHQNNWWAQRNLKRSYRSYSRQFVSLWLASWADQCMSLRSRRTVGGSAGSHAIPAEMAYWVCIICYHGGDMGCGFCK